MKIGFFGGTFNPPHRGHVEAAATAIAQLQLDKLLLVPDNIPPHKDLPVETPPAEDRLAMLQTAAAQLPRAEVSDLEFQRPGKSYTYDSLVQVQAQYPGATLHLLVGSDMFLGIETWYRFRELQQMAVLVTFSREEADRQQLEDFGHYLGKTYGAQSVILHNGVVTISSTELRQALGQRGGREYLTDGVYSYIIGHRLYGAKPDFAWLREKAYAMLKPTRVPHVQGCEEEAVRLAERWGAPVEDARTAAILHDITKRLDLSEQLKLCQKYGIMIDNVEKQEVKLLHAKTGAAIAKAEFGVSDAVAEAIFWHTTGKADMTLLEKVIYMADYIEPTRDFPGVDVLRRMAYVDLDQALLMGLKMSIEDMKSGGITPHFRTYEAIAALETTEG